MLDIGHSLQFYTDTYIHLKKKKNVKKLTKFNKLLYSKTFEIKIRTLSYIINQLNPLSEKLQSHNFNIGALKTEIKLCFKTLLKLF